MGYFATALSLIALLAFVAFGQWLRHQRRMMIHNERLAAVEKGIDLPPLEREVHQRSWNVQRILLFAGMIWISLGVGAYVVLAAILAHPSEVTRDMPNGIQWIGVAPVGIGLAHLLTYVVGRNKE